MSGRSDFKDLVFRTQFQRETNGWNVKDEYKQHTLEELKLEQACGAYENFKIATFNVEKGLNVGQMMRTAVCFQANEFILIGNKKYDKRSTVGAHNYIKITHTKEKDFISYCKTNKIIPIFLETGKKTWKCNRFYWDYDALRIKYNLSDFEDYSKCFVFGSESDGIPEEIINTSEPSLSYSIKHEGVLRSLNVSTACAIICFDLTRI